MTDLDLAALKALADAATPGPWRAIRGASGTAHLIDVSANSADIAVVSDEHGPNPNHEADAAFIAAARTALPALIARVEQAEAAASRKYDEGFADAAERAFEAETELHARLKASESTLAGLRCVQAETVQRYDALRAAITELAESAVYADFGEYHPDGDGNEEIVLGVRESDLRALAAHPTKEGSTDE